MADIAREKTILCDLGNGLILRRATRADTEELATFNGYVHGMPGSDKPDLRAAAWVCDLMERPHPTFDVGDFTVVVDTHTGKIVSSLNLIPQTWTYAGIPFKVGRPELVGTLPEYRKRGLVRAQFEVIHRWCTERDYKLQAITGIPYYYRQFGYEMCLNLGGGRFGPLAQIPRLKEGETEPFLIRPAVEADIPLLCQLYNASCQQSLVSCIWDEVLWRYELTGKSPNNGNRHEVRMITTPQGESVGFFMHPIYRWGASMGVNWYVLKPGVSYAAVTPSVMRYLLATGENLPPEHGTEPFEALDFGLGIDHPVYHVIPDWLHRQRQPYAWYIRLTDTLDFLRLITPVLDTRLAESPFAGHAGEINITFYRDGIRLAFEKGRLVKIEPYQPQPASFSGQAGFPGRTFWCLLFGYNTIDELRTVFIDCWADGEAKSLLGYLFPKQASNVWPVA